MLRVFETLIFAVKSYSASVMNLIFDPIVIFLALIIFGQYRNNIIIQRNMYGNLVKHKRKDLIVTSLLFGLIGGFLASIITSFSGITFSSDIGLEYVVIVSLLMMFINTRYICLAYSGGIVSLFLLIFNNLVSAGIISSNSNIAKLVTENINFDITALLFIVALMHLVEAMLIWVDGNRGAVPVFMKHKEKIVGAFLMQRFWIIPIILYLSLKGMNANYSTVEWFGFTLPASPKWMLKMAIPLVAMLGYADFAISTKPEEKAKRTSKGLFIYSIALLILVLISEKVYAFKFIAAIFAPLVHELLIIKERRTEFKGKPIYTRSDEGIVILDTLPGTPSEIMGMKPGDVIKSLNNIPIKTIKDVEEFFKNFIPCLWVELKDLEGNLRTLEYKDYKLGVDGLGVITIPEHEQGVPIIQDRSNYLEAKISKLLSKFNK